MVLFSWCLPPRSQKNPQTQEPPPLRDRRSDLFFSSFPSLLSIYSPLFTRVFDKLSPKFDRPASKKTSPPPQLFTSCDLGFFFSWPFFSFPRDPLRTTYNDPLMIAFFLGKTWVLFPPSSPPYTAINPFRYRGPHRRSSLFDYPSEVTGFFTPPTVVLIFSTSKRVL